MILTGIWLKIGAGALVLLLGVVGYQWIRSRSLEGQASKLEQERNEEKMTRVRVETELTQKVRDREAAFLKADELSQQAQMRVAEYEKRMGEVRAIDRKLEGVQAKYEQQKAQMPECNDDNFDACLRDLRARQCAAGYVAACQQK